MSMRLIVLPVCKFCAQIVYADQEQARVPSLKNPKYTNIVHAVCLNQNDDDNDS